MTRDESTLAQLLALGALVAVILCPPEVDGVGRMVLVVASTGAFLVLLAGGTIPVRYLRGGIAGAAFLLSHALWVSVDPYRSVVFSEILWCYYCLFGAFYYTPVRHRLSSTLVLLSAAVSAYGIYEFLAGNAAYGLSTLADTGEVIRSPNAGGSEPVRIMSTFAMPGTLWGFLLIALPLHLRLWKESSGLIKAGLVASMSLLLTASVMTRSYGFAAACAAMVLVWIALGTGKKYRRLLGVAVLGLLGLLTVGIYATRAGGYNPVSLRLQNWLTAGEIFAAYPFGAGLDAFAVTYPQHQQPGANESQYAHNTPLQIVAETGVFGLCAFVLGLAFLVRRRRQISELIHREKLLALALAAWIVHNLIDVDVYFASVGAVGVSLVAALWASDNVERSHELGTRAPRWLLGGMSAIGATVVLSSGLIFVSGELLRRAQTELTYLRGADADQTLATALAINPFNSSILHEAGQVALERYQDTGDESALARSTDYFARAVRLSPHKVGPHLGLALVHATSGERDASLDQVEIAQSMQPYSRYVSSVRRLIENRPAEPEPAHAEPVPQPPSGSR